MYQFQTNRSYFPGYGISSLLSLRFCVVIKLLELLVILELVSTVWAIEISLPLGKDVLATSLLGQLFEDYFVKLPRAVKM